MAQKPGLLHKQIGNDWTPFTCGVSGGYFTPDGMISYLTTKCYARPVSWQPLPSFANEDSDCSVMLPDSQRTSQQTRSFGLAAKPKTVPDHLLIGNALVVDLPLPGSIKSAGTQEYQWQTLCSWQKTTRFGDKSQQCNATAECFASWWWWCIWINQNYLAFKYFIFNCSVSFRFQWREYAVRNAIESLWWSLVL